jgi:hypothetical protein
MKSKADNFALSAPHSGAIFVPSVQRNYAKLAVQGATPVRAMPANTDLGDLAFWTGNSKWFNHKYCLYSVGSHPIGSTIKSPLFNGAKGQYTLVGDSGFYQMGKGSMKGLKGLRTGMTGKQAEEAWRNQNYHARQWVTSNLGTYFDYGITMDFALWFNTNHGKNSYFHDCTDDQLIAMTVSNLDFIEANGLGKCKWLNVLHGTNPQNTMKWWNAVKHFKHGGWSCAGAAGWRGGLHNMLNLLLTVREEDGFCAGQDWLHMLGVSQPAWHMYFTAIQNKVREDNPNFQISYDSASAFRAGGANDEYALPPALTNDLKSWGVSYKRLSMKRSNTSNTALAFPQNTSPLGQMLEMRHLVVRDEPYQSRRVDSISNQLVTNHNIWVYLDAGRRVDEIAFGTNADRSRIPDVHHRALDVVEAAFGKRDPFAFINKHKEVLDAAAPMTYK